MLGKLMKYDFRCMIRKFGPLWAGLVAMAAINGFTVGHVLENSRFDGVLAFLFGGLPIVVLFALWVATCVMMIVFVCERFYKGLLGDEGYLMFTLPVTPAEHIASKLIVALVMELLTGLAALAGMLAFVMVYDGAGFLEALREFGAFLARLDIPQGVPGLIALLFLLAFASTVCTDLQIYLAISLGHLARKNRVAMSVIAFVGINMALSILLSLLSPLTRSINIDFTVESVQEALRYGTAAMWVAVLWQFVKSAGFFLGSNAILNSKLNLD